MDGETAPELTPGTPEFDAAKHLAQQVAAGVRELFAGQSHISRAEFDAIYRRAISSSGGKAKAAKRSLAGAERSFADAMTANTGLMVGLWLDPLAAEALAIEGGLPPEALHITLGYFGDCDQYDELTRAAALLRANLVAASAGPLTGDVGGYGRFYADADDDDEDPILEPYWAKPDLDGLVELREAVCRELCTIGLELAGDHDFIPHITLAYLPKGSQDPTAKPDPIALSFAALTFCAGDERTVLPLLGNPGIVDGGVLSEAMYGEIVVAPAEHGPQLFAENLFADVPAVVPILPKPGEYTYRGQRFSVTPRMIDTVIANFDSRVRPQDVAINMQHISKTAGAAGYIRSVHKRADGGLDGVPEFTDLGRALIERDRFKYTSAEIDDYTDPLTLAVTEDVLVGLALTTDPYFKETYLPRLAASEGAMHAAETVTKSEGDAGNFPAGDYAYTPDRSKPSTWKLRLTATPGGRPDPGIVGAAVAALSPGGFRGNRVEIPEADLAGVRARVRSAWKEANPDKAPGDMPSHMMAEGETMEGDETKDLTKLSDDQSKPATSITIPAEQRTREVKEFSDLRTRVELAERRADTAETKLAEFRKDKLKDKYTAEVMGHSAENNLAWRCGEGGVEAEVDNLISLAETFGEDSTQVRRQIAMKRDERQMLEMSGLLGQLGASTRGNGGAVDKAKFFADEYRKADPKLTPEAAMTRAYNEHPELYMEEIGRK